jgi:hypothetical protein
MRGNRAGRGFRRAGVLFAFIAIVGGALVAIAPAAPALTICADPCTPTAVDMDYTVALNTKLSVDAAHGLLSQATGPTGTHVDKEDFCPAVGDGFLGELTSVSLNGAFTYMPSAGQAGFDQIDYCIIDGDGNFDFAEINITILPSVKNDTYYTHVNQTLNVAAPGIFANDGGVDATAVSVNDALCATTTLGAVALGDNGAFTYTPPSPTFSGVDSFKYGVLDNDDDNEYCGTVTVVVDSTPPVVVLTAPSTVTLSTKVPVAWSATDSLSGVKSYDVGAKSAPWNAGFGSTVMWKTATSSTSSTRTGSFGRTYCFSARARDKAGNVSGWIGRCTSIPLKSGSLNYSGGWATSSNSSYFGGSARYTKTHAARMARTSVQAKRIWLVATKCGSCGTAQVRWNGVVTANVSLASSTTKHKQLVAIASFSSVHSGTLTVTVTSPSGKYVVVEGLAVSRT